MQKLTSFSKYQKDIIKKITKELGPSTPFKYEKTNSNHLKVLIDGLDKPLYTGCTPSDCKSGVNFMADLRSAIKAAKLKRQPKIVVSKRMNTAQLKAQYISNLTASCVKTVRTNIEQYTQKEKQMVIKENNISNLKAARKNLATNVFTQAQRMTRQPQYITGGDSKQIKNEILKHLNYMMPNTADYAHILKPVESMAALPKAVSTANGSAILPTSVLAGIDAANESNSTLNKAVKLAENISNQSNINSKPVRANNHTEAGAKTNAKTNAKTSAKTDNKMTKVGVNKNPAEELAAMTTKQAVKNLRRLSRNEAEAMLSHIKIAMEENQQQDLQEVLEMMACKGITLDMLSRHQAQIG